MGRILAGNVAAMPEIAETKLGPVEYVTRGQGRPVLVVHGTPGGHDQAEAMAGFLPTDEFQAIMPSRPGYLGTPLESRETIDQQADLHAALLEHLGVGPAAVLCWSGGGPSTYRLAVRHPQRVNAIVSLTAVSRRYPTPKQGLDERLMFRTAPGNWLLRMLARHAPKQMISATEGSEGDLTKEQLKAHVDEVFADPVKRDFVLALDASVAQDRTRRSGFDNDMAQFDAIDDLELQRIAVPTLVVWGDADSDVAPSFSEYTAATIPGAQALVLPGGTHLAFYTHTDAADAQARALTLLRR
jgi:pimeloyl-ACP methyl ester carboxylesterase